MLCRAGSSIHVNGHTSVPARQEQCILRAEVPLIIVPVTEPTK